MKFWCPRCKRFIDNGKLIYTKDRIPACMGCFSRLRVKAIVTPLRRMKARPVFAFNGLGTTYTVGDLERMGLHVKYDGNGEPFLKTPYGRCYIRDLPEREING